MAKDKYQPTPEEISKAEEMMTPEQKQQSEIRSEAFMAGQETARVTHDEQDRIKSEEGNKVRQIGVERFARVSEFMSENLSTKEFLEKFPDAQVVWFGNFGGTTKSHIEEPKKGNYYDQFDHAFIFNERDAKNSQPAISGQIRNDGWDKYYLCADASIANYLRSLIPVDQRS
jgi:hypothetical protein